MMLKVIRGLCWRCSMRIVPDASRSRRMRFTEEFPIGISSSFGSSHCVLVSRYSLCLSYNVLALETRGQSLKIKTPLVDLVRVSYDKRNANGNKVSVRFLCQKNQLQMEKCLGKNFPGLCFSLFHWTWMGGSGWGFPISS